MELGAATQEASKRKSKAVPLSKVADNSQEYKVLSPQELEKLILALENEMYQHAQNLEFEQAAAKRDQIEEYRKQFIVNS
ncbi:excinuclease ABC subunit B [Vibrio ishigakensis]|nr:excinuclease ABC subunit B [Vibrio ishigakensis]